MVMKKKKKMQSLRERAWRLHDEINGKIEDKSRVSLCRLCSENGVYCGGVREIPFQEDKERQDLIAIKDSLQHLHHLLLFLEKLESSQEIHMNSTINLLEEKKLLLLEGVNQHKKQFKKLEVIEELKACLGDTKTLFTRNPKKDLEKKTQKTAKNRVFTFLIRCISSLFNPWKLILVSASISMCQIRRIDLGKQGFSLSDPNSPLDVMYGRG